jgi:hypothetical protein
MTHLNTFEHRSNPLQLCISAPWLTCRPDSRWQPLCCNCKGSCATDEHGLRGSRQAQPPSITMFVLWCRDIGRPLPLPTLNKKSKNEILDRKTKGRSTINWLRKEDNLSLRGCNCKKTTLLIGLSLVIKKSKNKNDHIMVGYSKRKIQIQLTGLSTSCRQIFWIGMRKIWLCKINLKNNSCSFFVTRVHDCQIRQYTLSKKNLCHINDRTILLCDPTRNGVIVQPLFVSFLSVNNMQWPLLFSFFISVMRCVFLLSSATPLHFLFYQSTICSDSFCFLFLSVSWGAHESFYFLPHHTYTHRHDSMHDISAFIT